MNMVLDQIEPKIFNIPERKLIGMRIKTSLSENKTKELWQQFMPRRKEIRNLSNTELYSVQIYDGLETLASFTPETIFEKWAAVEVDDIGNVPPGMESHALSGGKYAVFAYKGTHKAFFRTTNYIFGTWLPKSDYQLDDREHFEIMGEQYLGPDDPNSEEEVWIPIR